MSHAGVLLNVSTVMQVVVSGAGGRTGSLIMQKLLARPDTYKARGIVRNEEVCLETRILPSALPVFARR